MKISPSSRKSKSHFLKKIFTDAAPATHINLIQPQCAEKKPAASDFPDGHPPGYQPCVTFLNFRDLLGSGAFNMLSPSLSRRECLSSPTISFPFPLSTPNSLFTPESLENFAKCLLSFESLKRKVPGDLNFKFLPPRRSAGPIELLILSSRWIWFGVSEYHSWLLERTRREYRVDFVELVWQTSFIQIQMTSILH